MTLTPSELQRVHAVRAGLRQFHRWSGSHVRAAGLTPALHDLLLSIQALNNDGGPSITTAATALALTHHSTVELVNRAAASGHLQRAPDHQDRRVVRLTLTPAGEHALSSLAPHHREQLRRLEDLLTATKRDGQ